MRAIYIVWYAFFFTVLVVDAQSPEVRNLEKEIEFLDGEDYYAKTNDLVEVYLEQDVERALRLINGSVSSAGIQEYKGQLARAKYLRSQCLMFLGDYKESIKSYHEAIGLLEKLNNDSLLAKSFNGVAVVYSLTGEQGKAQDFFESAMLRAEQFQDRSILADVYFRFGQHKFRTKQKDAHAYFDRSLEIYRRLKNRKGESDVMYWKAVVYNSQKREEKALEYHFASRAIKEEIHDVRGLAASGMSLGAFNWERGNYSTAMEFYNKSVVGYEALGDISSTARLYNNIGLVYEDWNKLDSALVYYNKSMELHKRMNSEEGRIRSFLNIGQVYTLQSNYKESKVHFLKAKFYSERTREKYLLASIYDGLAENHLVENRLDSSEAYLHRSLLHRVKTNQYFGQRRTYLNFSNLEKKRGDFKKALRYFEIYHEILDSLSGTRREKELAEIQAKYDNEKKEKEIIELQRKNKKGKFWKGILTFEFLLTAVASILLFEFFRYRNKTNRELLEVKERQRLNLEETDKIKTRFFNNISHEFRTPLTLILGPLNDLERRVDIRHYPTIKIIERNARRLLKLINQLLDLSKIDAGRMELRVKRIDIVPLLKGWIASFQPMASKKGVELDIKFGHKYYYLYLNHLKLEEIMLNLISNAVRHTGEGGKVSIDVQEEKQGNVVYAKLIVADSGTGIPKTELKHVFDRFYQVSNSNSGDHIGTGIGLALVKELVDLHKGKVEVSSEEGKGSIFTVYLRKGESHFSQDEIITISPYMGRPVEESKLEMESFSSEQQNKVVDGPLPILLLVEDNDDLRAYLSKFLSAAYNVREARDGQEGVDLAFELLPDVVISDLMMPKLDGLELCKLLKEDLRTSHIPIVLLTARASVEDKIEGLRNLADDYIIKPCNNEELLTRVTNLIELRKKIQAQYRTDHIMMPKKVQHNSVDEIFMEKMTEVLEIEISNSLFGIEDLCQAVLMSRSQLFRKMKALTNLTPNVFIRNFRLHRAMDMIQKNVGTISEIAYAVGFQNSSYFAKCFQEYFGKLPSEVKGKPEDSL
ncbi:tetratricopeptide repeat protein [Flagellimonas algicola]|uniref:histidine kinase n=1 Tax=Flagellimonas algicola TaxID=2583815 RepID=A0ABY2WGG5_9FLAO|nr:tetratricopeptide repeat protein [Allomuricauda algicola]TMU50382.1 tetratricopeptide repeat protein [Allomuricauda algicola]